MLLVVLVRLALGRIDHGGKLLRRPPSLSRPEEADGCQVVLELSRPLLHLFPGVERLERKRLVEAVRAVEEVVVDALPVL